MTEKTTKIKVCHGNACRRNLAPYSLERAKNDIKALKLDHIECEECPCLGRCDKGPNVVVEQDGKQQSHSYATPVEMGKIIRNIKKKK
jgi:NADH:ubiquinone oxidoreductase subunit E